MTWSRPFTHPIRYTKPKPGSLRTLADARAYALKRKPGTTDRAWQRAMALMIEAAEGNGNVAAVERQLTLALLLDGALDLKVRDSL